MKQFFRAVLGAASDVVCYIILCLQSDGPGEASFSGLCVKGFPSALLCVSLTDAVNPVTHSGFLDILTLGKLSQISSIVLGSLLTSFMALNSFLSLIFFLSHFSSFRFIFLWQAHFWKPS